VALYQEAERRGILTARINMLLSYDSFASFNRLKLRSGFGSDRPRFGGVKTFVDGAIGADPPTGAAVRGSRGSRHADDLHRAAKGDVDRPQRRSRLAVHANGDRAIALLLT
jgi:predicted amidohydrolase YtcJ